MKSKIFSMAALLVFCMIEAKGEIGDTLKIKRAFNTVLINNNRFTFSKAKILYRGTFDHRVEDTLFYKITETGIFGYMIGDEIMIAQKNGQCLIKVDRLMYPVGALYTSAGVLKKYIPFYDINSKPGQSWKTGSLFGCDESNITFEGKILDDYTNEFLYVFRFTGGFSSHTDHVSKFYVSLKKGLVRLDFSELYGGKIGEIAVRVSRDYVKRRKLKAYLKNTRVQ